MHRRSCRRLCPRSFKIRISDPAIHTVPPRHGAVDALAYAAAVALASAAAWFSIRRIVVLFPGAPVSVVCMAVAMESAKLVTVAWLSRRWRTAARLLRLVLVVLLAGLAVINAAGVFSQLVAAHVGERAAAASAVQAQDAELAARIDVAADQVADLDRQIGQIDGAVTEATRRGRTSAALSAMDRQRQARAALAGEREKAAAEPSHRTGDRREPPDRHACAGCRRSIWTTCQTGRAGR